MKRVLLKLSGEALAGEKKTGFDEATVIEVAKQIRTIAEEGLEIGIVIGGGNFWPSTQMNPPVKNALHIFIGRLWTGVTAFTYSSYCFCFF